MGKIWLKYMYILKTVFWLNPMYEIGLNSIGEIRFFTLSYLLESLYACVS